MIQPQWPGLGPSYSPTPFPGGSYGAIQSPTNAGLTPADGISPGWWNAGGAGNANDGWGSAASGYGASGSSIYGVLQSLIGMLGQLVGSLMNGSGSTSGATGTSPWPGNGWSGNGSYNGWSGTNGSGNGGATGSPCGPNAGAGCNSPQQYFSNVAISSTGDPHIAETGTRQTPGGGVSIDQHYDSMTSHGDLVDAPSAAGGYRVSTIVTQPNDKGVTWNQSATVSADGNRDAITMNRDGSFAITSNGQAESLSRGQSLTLAGGETVTENNDGSLAVSAANGRGGMISTTLRAADGGVNVSVQASNIGLGGDVVAHDAGASWEQPAPPRHTPWRDTDGVAATPA